MTITIRLTRDKVQEGHLRQVVVSSWADGALDAYMAARTALARLGQGTWGEEVDITLSRAAAYHLLASPEVSGETVVPWGTTPSVSVLRSQLEDALAQEHAAQEAATNEQRRADRPTVRDSRNFEFPQ